MNLEDLKSQIVATQTARAADAKNHQASVKVHQEGYEAAMNDLRRLSRVLAMLKADDEPDPELTSCGEELAHENTHRIDVGEMAAQMQVTNPFAEKPQSLAHTLWTVMQDGHDCHVMKDIVPALTRLGYSWSESSIYNTFRREPEVFEGEGGIYHVTRAYRVRKTDDDA